MARISVEAAGGRNVVAFLDTIAFSEGTDNDRQPTEDDGYDVLVGGGTFNGYADHPRLVVQTRYGMSDAAGRYQIMAAVPGKITTDTWDWASRAAGVVDFSPISQDKVAILLITRRGAMEDLRAGRFDEAVRKCRQEWASLPGAGYGQREQDLSSLRDRFIQAGGDLGA